MSAEDGWLTLSCALKDNTCSLGSIKLLVNALRGIKSNVDSCGLLPLHIACELRSVKIVKFLMEEYDHVSSCCDSNKDSIVHYACRGANLNVIKYLLKSHAALVSSVTMDANNKLPIHLLCEAGKEGKVDCDSPEYIETIWLMLLANPEVVMTQVC